MTVKRKVPELSLLSYVNGGTQDQVKFVDDFFSGIKDYGFIILKDHIIDQTKVDKAYEIIYKFFTLEDEIKKQYDGSDNGGQRGYTAFGVEHAKDNPFPDLKEFWHVGRQVPTGHELKSFYPDNVWPKEIKEFKETLSELYTSMDETSVVLLEALGRALDVEKDYFTKMIYEGNSILRCIHYPPIADDANPKSIRAAAHGDINLITMLVGATDDGLELLDRDGKWLPVNSLPGQIVVDSGDMLSRITNDVIPTTVHRVVNPNNSKARRFSMPFFVHPRPDAELKCLSSCVGNGEKYPPINSHEFLLQRLRDIGLTK